jgi:hypothetical protein
VAYTNLIPGKATTAGAAEAFGASLMSWSSCSSVPIPIDVAQPLHPPGSAGAVGPKNQKSWQNRGGDRACAGLRQPPRDMSLLSVIVRNST